MNYNLINYESDKRKAKTAKLIANMYKVIAAKNGKKTVKKKNK